jgi:hypothetical protein
MKVCKIYPAATRAKLITDVRKAGEFIWAWALALTGAECQRF